MANIANKDFSLKYGRSFKEEILKIKPFDGFMMFFKKLLYYLPQ